MTITKVALAGGKAVVVEQQTASGGERDFQVLFAKNPLPAWVYSVMTLSILEVNDAAVNRYGWTRKEFLRMRVTDLYPPQEMLRLVDTLRSDSVLLEDNGQWQHCLSDGRIIDIEVRSRRLKLGKQEVVLLVAQDITECKREEISLQRNNSFKDLVISIASRLIMPSLENVDTVISDSLRDIGGFAGVDRAYVFLLREGGQLMDNTHEWCAAGIEPQMRNFQGFTVKALPWLHELLTQGKHIQLPRVKGSLADRDQDRQLFLLLNIPWYLLMPLIYDGRITGFVGVDSIYEERTWSEVEIGLIKVVAAMFAALLERKRLADRQEHLLTVMEESAGHIGVWSICGQVLHLSTGGPIY